MSKHEHEGAMRQAMVALVDAKDPVTKGRLMRRVVQGIVERNSNLTDLIDLVFSFGDPRRASTRAEIDTYLKEHPGEWTQKRDDDLRRAIASDRSLPRSFFRDFS